MNSSGDFFLRDFLEFYNNKIMISDLEILFDKLSAEALFLLSLKCLDMSFQLNTFVFRMRILKYFLIHENINSKFYFFGNKFNNFFFEIFISFQFEYGIQFYLAKTIIDE